MAISHPPALERALAALAAGTNRDPFAVLGPHRGETGRGIVVRAFQPAARAMDLVLRETGEARPMTALDPPGLFEAAIGDGSRADAGRNPSSAITPDYRLRAVYASGHAAELDDPYRYGRVLTDYDLHLLAEGTHHRAFEKL